MRGYFGIGIDQVSKAGNLGNLVRTAHAFGAAFAFAINPYKDPVSGKSVAQDHADTAKSAAAMPVFEVDSLADLPIPQGARIVAVELSEDAIDLPSFRHPKRALYVLGGERFEVSRQVLDRADDVIRIPTRFSLNVATAGAIVMYDRHRLLGGYADRPVMPGQMPLQAGDHRHGGPISRIERRRAREQARTDALRHREKQALLTDGVEDE